MALTVVNTYPGTPVVFLGGTPPSWAGLYCTTDVTGVTAGNLLMLVGTKSLRSESEAALAADGWVYVTDSPPEVGAASLWVALKVADGTETNITLFGTTTPTFCPGLGREFYFVAVEMSGGGVAYEWNMQSGPGIGVDPIAFGDVTMVGDGIVFAAAVSKRAANPITTDPVGYTLLDTYAFTYCPNEEFALWDKVVTAGTETPGDSDDVDNEWYTVTLGVYGFEASVIEQAVIELLPNSVSTPLDTGTDTGVDPDTRLPDAFQLPPEPAGIEVPGPTWEETP